MIPFIGRASSQCRMQTLPMVIGDPSRKAYPQFRAGLKGMEIDAFVFERPPQALDEHVIEPTSAPVHADADLAFLQHFREPGRRKLRALIRVEDIRSAIADQGLLQRLAGGHRVRQAPRQNLTRRPVHDRREVAETLAYRDVGDVRAPDLIAAIDQQIPQEIRIFPMRRMWDGRAWLLVERPQTHRRHQSTDTLAPVIITNSLEMRDHLPRPVIGRLQKLHVYQPHKNQAGLTVRHGPVVNALSVQLQQRGLPHHG